MLIVFLMLYKNYHRPEQDNQFFESLKFFD